ncbi:hypothetical protein [Flavobacterium hydrophilum]|uniref:Uncharacterized protein n=1 Tax=Flavobacterium hydrophilum TaxID=2211445 RepID=A0A2V4C030_9FLAO|nr:hypothetical protein [Flavobacterium hydrophilum]PXY44327.1 hypothetical protein DMB68_18070 [Flavobacterium hydrophilum]
MRNNIINIFIGVVLLISGLCLHNSNNGVASSVFLKYLGVVLVIYGTFVILTKAIKIIISLNTKYKKLTTFEKNNKRVIPDFVRKILEYRLENNKDINFEIPNYGKFQIINYNVDKGNDFNNPYHILKEIDEHIGRYFFPVISYSKIIPFAVNNNYKFLFVEEGKKDVVLIDLDSEDTRPLILKSKIDYYIDINKLELRKEGYYYNGLKKIEDIIDKNNYFFDVSDCIFEGKDYFEFFAKSFNLLEKNLVFSFSSVEETEQSYILNLNIEDKSKKIKLEKSSHYIDSENFIGILNEILSLLNYNQKQYYLISNNICDFGVVLADEKTFQVLSDNGCIELNEVKLNSDELIYIRKYNDLIREIENIEFHLNIVKKDNEIEKELLYNFFYKTDYEFDSSGMNVLQQRLKVYLKKADSGYDVYFTK